MKKSGWIVFLALLLISPGLADSTVYNQGHRGTGANAPGNDYPENTIPSFIQGFAEGADMVELDTQLSQDEAVVVIHDATLNRTTDCTGSVRDLNLAEIQACDAGYGTPMAGQGFRCPPWARFLQPWTV